MGTDGLAKGFLGRFKVAPKLWRLYFGKDTILTFKIYCVHMHQYIRK